MAEMDDFLAFGHEVLAEAGALAAQHFRQTRFVDSKRQDGFDPVTQADRAVERRIRERIEARFPNHAITGEEFGDQAGASAWRWIVDPIDGTRAFLMGLPVWGCLLGLLRDGEPVAGFMRQPILGETFSGDGRRAWLTRDGRRQAIQASREVQLQDAILTATEPAMFAPQALARFEALAARVRMMRYGGDCYNYCLLAYGLVDIVVEDDLMPYDILPLVPIVRGAGGCISNLSGETPQGGLVVAAAGQRLHLEALGAMRGRLQP